MSEQLEQLRQWWDQLPREISMPIAAFAGISLLVFMFGWALVSLSRRNGPVSRRLVFGRLTDPLSKLIPQTKSSADRLTQELRKAGKYHPKARQEFLAVRNVMTLGCITLTWAWLMLNAEPGSTMLVPILLAGGIATLMAYSLQFLFLEWFAAGRVQRIQSGLPDALDIITMCLTGGQPLQRALQTVGKEIRPIHPDLATEFDIIYTQTETGSLDQALTQFSQRIDVPEVRSLTTIVHQTQSLGANVSGALRDFGDEIRRAHRQRAEERGNKTSVKLLFPIALCLTPPVYILLLGPALLEIKEFVERENQPGGVLQQDTPEGINNPLAPAPTTSSLGI